MVSYTKSFRTAYPEPNYKFLLELARYTEKFPNDRDASNLERYIIDDWDLKITKPLFWSVRKRVAMWYDDLRTEWACNPESETYKCS